MGLGSFKNQERSESKSKIHLWATLVLIEWAHKNTFIWINLRVGQIYILRSWWLLWERWKERTGEEWRPRQDSKADSDQNDSNFQVPLRPLFQAATSSLQSTRTSELLCHPFWKTSWLPFHPFWNFLKIWQCCSSINLHWKWCEKSDDSFFTSIDFIFHFRFITPDDLTGSPLLKPFPLSLSSCCDELQVNSVPIHCCYHAC